MWGLGLGEVVGVAELAVHALRMGLGVVLDLAELALDALGWVGLGYCVGAGSAWLAWREE